MRRLLLMITTAVLAVTMLAVPTAGAIEAEPGPDAEVREVDEVRPPKPKIRCRGTVGLGGAPKVKCRWTESEHPAASGYKIVRVEGDRRKVVFRTGDTSVTRFTDKDVEFNTRYKYRVVVVNEAGRRIQRSRWNRAYVAKPDTEVLKLDCQAVDTRPDIAVDIRPRDQLTDIQAPERAKSVLCKWRPAERRTATQYQLWRLISGHHRELVATVGLDQVRYLDHVPANTTKVVYAVLALDADGEIVGRSRLSKVYFPTSGG